MSRLWIAVAALAFAGAVFGGTLYKWKDADGNWHFSDQAPEGVKAETLSIRSFSGPAEVADAGGNYGAGSVVMLSTEWCGYCKQARAYMNGKGIPFTEYDVEKSAKGAEEYRRLQGRGVPIILVGERRMNGFSADQLEQLLNAK